MKAIDTAKRNKHYRCLEYDHDQKGDICLIACGAWAKPGRRPSLRFVLYSVLATALFLTAMMLLRTHMMLNIALTVLAVFLVFAALFGFSRHMDREDRSSGERPELFSR